MKNKDLDIKDFPVLLKQRTNVLNGGIPRYILGKHSGFGIFFFFSICSFSRDIKWRINSRVLCGGREMDNKMTNFLALNQKWVSLRRKREIIDNKLISWFMKSWRRGYTQLLFSLFSGYVRGWRETVKTKKRHTSLSLESEQEKRVNLNEEV